VENIKNEIIKKLRQKTGTFIQLYVDLSIKYSPLAKNEKIGKAYRVTEVVFV